MAALTAKLWDQGTRDLTATQLAEALDALGTSLSIAADGDMTEMSFTVQKQALADTAALVGSLVAEPRFEEADFRREKKLQLSALASGPDNPQWIAQRVLPMLLCLVPPPLRPLATLLFLPTSCSPPRPELQSLSTWFWPSTGSSCFRWALRRWPPDTGS